MELWWTCPNCDMKVSFTHELLGTCFDEKDGEAYFKAGADGGIIFHTIFCSSCGVNWTMSISGMSTESCCQLRRIGKQNICVLLPDVI